MKLTKFENMLEDWIKTIDIHSSVNQNSKNGLMLIEGLIFPEMRPTLASLFREEDKYFYVWLMRQLDILHL